MITSDINTLIEIPTDEAKQFDKLIKDYRSKYITDPNSLVNQVFEENPQFSDLLSDKKVTEVIIKAREMAWNKFLVEEEVFNTKLLTDLGMYLKTPKEILDSLINLKVTSVTRVEMVKQIKEVCGEYAGRIYPYIYKLSLSNTNSRRSRAGVTFQSLIYRIYEKLGYPYESQKKVGKKTFESAGLGKMVDSILPGINEFAQRRNKTIIGSMKTTLRERWQEVIEEIQRTNIPEIFLLTVDEVISTSKATQMNQHNVTLVVPNYVAKQEKLSGMKNIISFEDYFFDEIPSVITYWKNV